MILDSSALIAVLRQEADADDFIQALATAQRPRVSAATYVQAAVLVDASHDPVLSRRYDQLLATVDAVVEPVTREHAELARQAYRDVGKGSGHPAGLNVGDCFSYALARATGEPLLVTGDHFSHTDVAAVVR